MGGVQSFLIWLQAEDVVFDDMMVSTSIKFQESVQYPPNQIISSIPCSCCFLEELPWEIHLIILRYLDVKTILRLSCLNSFWRNSILYEPNGLWNQIFIDIYRDTNCNSIDLVHQRKEGLYHQWRDLVISREILMRNKKKRRSTTSSSTTSFYFGGLLRKQLSTMFFTGNYKSLLLGGKGSGKTTIISRFQEIQNTTKPSIEHDFLMKPETVDYKNINISTMHIEKDQRLRLLFVHLYPFIDGLILVVDSTNHTGIKEIAEHLHSLLREEYLNVTVLLVFANKKDVPGCMSPSEICHRLDLFSSTLKSWNCQPCCALTGEGLIDGIDWFLEELSALQ